MITIYLLLSGDIHQCPGPTNGLTSDSHHSITSNHCKSIPGNSQVRTFTTSYMFELNTHLDSLISPASAAEPVIGADVVTGWMDPSGTSGEFTGCAARDAPVNRVFGRGRLPGWPWSAVSPGFIVRIKLCREGFGAGECCQQSTNN
uniref:Uncharacterized protein n=1 Tax=Knipowitschia caucasica TaxID=637954 RepID=A0AAV2L8Z7_KNICA